MIYSTEQRNILLSFLKSNPDIQFTVKQIESALENKNISRSAVYRNLAELESNGSVKRCTKAGSRDTFFQYYDSENCKNHIHLSCIQCGRLFHLESNVSDNLINNIEQSQGFEISKSATTLYGICKDCSEIQK